MQSTCVKCGGKTFESVDNSPIGSNFKYSFIQCATCGGVVGVVEFINLYATLQRIAEKLGVRV